MSEMWYVASAVPGQERSAAINIRAHGFDVFVPVATRLVVVRGIEIERSVMLFGPYLFVAFEREEEKWRVINSTACVRHLLPMHEEFPVAMPPGIVEKWIERSLVGEFSAKEAAFSLGETIEVVSGRMAGARGEFVGVKNRMIEMMLRMLGREVIVKVSPKDVRVCGDL